MEANDRAPHILFHRPTPWASEVTCSTKVLARAAARAGAKVGYLEAPRDPVHVLKGHAPPAGGPLSLTAEGVARLTPSTPVPVRDVWPLSGRAASRAKYALLRPPLPALAARAGLAPRLIWTTVPGSVGPLQRLFPAARVAAHVIDYYPAFRGPAVMALERDDYARADRVYLIGHALLPHVRDVLGTDPGKIEVLGQGVDVERFAADEAAEKNAGTRPDTAGPRGLYCGVLSKLDPGLTEALAQALAARSGTLTLIGPDAPWIDALAAKLPGTLIRLGPQPPEALPRHFHAADFAMMLYDRARQEVYRGQNPLKLYEYAAAGLPILSTDHDEYAHLAPPAAVVGTEAEVAPALAALLKDQPARAAAARRFAQAHSWDDKLTTIFDRYFPDHAARKD